MNKFKLLFFIVFLTISCAVTEEDSRTHVTNTQAQPVTFDARSQAFTDLFGQTPHVETIATGLLWAEGPLWIDNGEYLLFTDVPGNKIYQWSRENGVSVFQDPSGAPSNPEIYREPGANGLYKSGHKDTILVANHGKRAVTRLNLSSLESETIVSHYQDKKFNSPNDIARASDGSIYFTDPPYGLKDLDNSPYKELSINGVYRVTPDGEVSLLTDQFTRPNGIALSPDENMLYVANSDPENPIIVGFPLHDGKIKTEQSRLIHNGLDNVNAGALGLPDGMVIDNEGRIFATAPGGVHVFSPQGDLLGIINTGTANANCTLGENGLALYIAAHSRIIRIALK